MLVKTNRYMKMLGETIKIVPYFIFYNFLWVIPRLLKFMFRCSEKSARKVHTPGGHAKEGIQHSQHGEILLSRTLFYISISYNFFEKINEFLNVNG